MIETPDHFTSPIFSILYVFMILILYRYESTLIEEKMVLLLFEYDNDLFIFGHCSWAIARGINTNSV